MLVDLISIFMPFIVILTIIVISNPSKGNFISFIYGSIVMEWKKMDSKDNGAKKNGLVDIFQNGLAGNIIKESIDNTYIEHSSYLLFSIASVTDTKDCVSSIPDETYLGMLGKWILVRKHNTKTKTN